MSTRFLVALFHLRVVPVRRGPGLPLCLLLSWWWRQVEEVGLAVVSRRLGDPHRWDVYQLSWLSSMSRTDWMTPRLARLPWIEREEWIAVDLEAAELEAFELEASELETVEQEVVEQAYGEWDQNDSECEGVKCRGVAGALPWF